MTDGNARVGASKLPLSQHPLMTRLVNLASELSPERAERLFAELGQTVDREGGGNHAKES